MPAYFHPGWTWSSAEPPPDTVVCCYDSDTNFVLVALWPAGAGTQMGFIPLGSGDQRLRTLPMIGHWKQQDASLSSVGTLPGGLITLAPPVVPEDYAAELIGRRGFPPSPANLATTWAMVCQQFVLKAYTFISSRDQRAADRFIDDHGSAHPGRDDAQRILDDLAAWDRGILPYMQDMPRRIRALALHMDDATLWQDLRRQG